VGAVWHLVFTTELDGTSLAHLLRTVRGVAGLLLIVRTDDRRVFGAFLDSTLTGEAAFGSGGESYLFSVAEMALPPVPERQISSPSPSGRISSRVVAIPYRRAHGRSSHFVHADQSTLMLGSGGRAGAGLTLEGELIRGWSGHCDTFNNEPLSLIATPSAPSPPSPPPIGSACEGSVSMGVRGEQQPSQPQQLSPARSAGVPSAAGSRGGGGSERSPAGSKRRRSPRKEEPPAASSSAAAAAAVATAATATAASGQSERVDFVIERVEVWAIDERACRGLPLLASHVRLPMN